MVFAAAERAHPAVARKGSETQAVFHRAEIPGQLLGESMLRRYSARLSTPFSGAKAEKSPRSRHWNCSFPPTPADRSRRRPPPPVTRRGNCGPRAGQRSWGNSTSARPPGRAPVQTQRQRLLPSSRRPHELSSLRAVRPPRRTLAPPPRACSARPRNPCACPGPRSVLVRTRRPAQRSVAPRAPAVDATIRRNSRDFPSAALWLRPCAMSRGINHSGLCSSPNVRLFIIRRAVFRGAATASRYPRDSTSPAPRRRTKDAETLPQLLDRVSHGVGNLVFAPRRSGDLPASGQDRGSESPTVHADKNGSGRRSRTAGSGFSSTPLRQPSPPTSNTANRAIRSAGILPPDTSARRSNPATASPPRAQFPQHRDRITIVRVDDQEIIVADEIGGGGHGMSPCQAVPLARQT